MKGNLDVAAKPLLEVTVVQTKRAGMSFITPYLYVLPCILLLGVFVYVPLVTNFYYSTLSFSAFSPEKVFVGLQNYKEMFADPIIRTALVNNIWYCVISVIFQEPMTSLNPVFRCGYQIDEVLKLHNPGMSKEEVKKRSIEMLELVGIANSEGVYSMYPHELSGGMRQRVMIAMALACSPGLIIADEPTTALDVTIQAQILDLLKDLKDKISSSIMLITHDLGVIASMADYVVVMYAGRVVEKGTTEDIFHHPCHPYTIGLMKSKPVVGKKVDALYNIPGSVPNPVNMPDYCYFRDRCEQCVDKCHGVYPPEIRLNETHVVSCWRYEDEGKIERWPKSVNVEEL